jgi:hypothetical protein
MRCPVDSGTQRLVDDLTAKPQSFARDEMIDRVLRLRYHSFKSPYAAPDGVLVKHLTMAGFPDLAERVLDGRYDQPKSESDKWAEQTVEGRECEAMRADPDMRKSMDAIVSAAADKKFQAEARAFVLRCIRERRFKGPMFDDRKVREPREGN